VQLAECRSLHCVVTVNVRHWWKWVGGGILAVIVVAAFWQLDWKGAILPFIQSIDRLGVWGPVVFILVYMTATVVLFPPSILSLGAGAIFGFWKGALLVLIGANLGATAAFLIGRHFARDWLASKLQDKPRLKALDRAVAEEGWKIVLLMRLSPIFPFKLLNYALGLTRVSVSGYVIASVVGNTPGALVWVYSGTLARWGLFRDRELTPVEWALYGVGFLATAGLAVYFSRLAKRALDQRMREDQESS
jgi:uncharacterized membrane protein YdjX (TVP38/TMEM64 family)